MSICFSRLVGRSGLLAVSAAFGLYGCAAPPTDSAVSEAEEIQVVTTFLPITQFTEAVVGDRAQVTQLLPDAVGPHDFQAKPGDVQAIAEADIVIENGLELEFFLDGLLDNSGNDDVVVIDSSEGIKTLAFEAHGDEHSEHDDEHSEDHDDDHSDHDEEHSEDHDDEHSEHAAHGDLDPHIWLDPKRAILQVENIRDGLIAVDPAGEPEYTANADAYITELTALDEEITTQLSPYAGRTFISFHDFAAYFADSYGLEVEFLVDVPEVNPSPEDVSRVIETVKSESIQALMAESEASQASFSSLSKDLGIEVSVFDPVAVRTDEVGPDYYLSVMRQNVKNLTEALGES